MISSSVWENGVSWEDRCRCIQAQKDELSKKVNVLEDALRQARTRCDHLESLVKQAARRHLQQKYSTSTEIDFDGNFNFLDNYSPDDHPPANGGILVKNKFNRDEQDFITDLQKRNSILQQQCNKIHQKLKYAIQLIKKYKKEINTLRLRAESKRRSVHTFIGSNKRKGVVQKSVDSYNHDDLGTDHLDHSQNEHQPFTDVSNVGNPNVFHSANKLIENTASELNETKVAYTLLQTQYAVLNSKMDSQCKIQKQLIAKLEESNEYIAKLQNEAETLTREKLNTTKSFQLKIEAMEEDLTLLKMQNTLYKDKLLGYDASCNHDHRWHEINCDHRPRDANTTEADRKQLAQDLEILRQKSAEDQKQIIELQAELSRSLHKVSELSINLQQLSNELNTLHHNTDRINEKHHLAEMALQEALSNQCMAFEALDFEMREKEVQVQITLDEFKATIERLESTCSRQANYITHLEQTKVKAEKGDFSDEGVMEDEKELQLVSSELQQVSGYPMSSQGDLLHLDSLWHSATIWEVARLNENVTCSYLKLQVVNADLSSCSVIDSDKDGITFALVDFLDFESRASYAAKGRYPSYNFESTFFVHDWMSVMAQYYNRKYFEDSKRVVRNKENIPRIPMAAIAIGIYHVRKNRSISLLAWSTPKIDWTFATSKGDKTKKGFAWKSLDSDQYQLISPYDGMEIVGTIELRIGYKREGDDIYYNVGCRH